MAQVEKLAIPSLLLGEGPHWEAQHQALIFVDVFKKGLRRHFIDTNRHQLLDIDDPAETVSFVVPVEGEPDLYLMGLGKAIAAVRWSPSDPDVLKVKPKTIQTTTDDHFNDAKCDPQGRLWAGTMGPLDDKGELLEYNNSSLFKFDHDLSFTQWVTKVTISNGLAWSSDRKTLFYIDSPAATVDAFDYNDVEGSISNRRVLLDYKKAGLLEQVPDGMSIDVNDNLWVACFGGSQVICIDPREGKVIQRVTVPSKNVTSVCWGGPNYDILFVTTGTLKLSKEEIAANPSAGGTFAIKGLGTKGLPPTSYKPDLTKFRAKMA